MSRCLTFVALVCAYLATASPGVGGEKKPADDLVEKKVRLRVNAIETAVITEQVEMLIKREFNLRGSVRACIASGDERLPQYQKALADAQTDLEQNKKKLVELESERAKLIERLGPKVAAEEAHEHAAKMTRLLEQILDRLISIEKRLQRLER